MKKKILGGIAAVAIAAIAALNINVNLEENNKLSILALNDLEALAGGESNCISTSGENTGTCKAKADGTGDVCVEPGFWDTKNCNK